MAIKLEKRRLAAPWKAKEPNVRLELSQQIGFQLRVAQDAAVQSLQRNIKDFKPGRLSILTAIADNPGLSQTDLGGLSMRDKSTITPTMVQLERLGLIERRRVDQRTYGIYLKPAGEALRNRLSAEAHDHDLRITAIIGEQAKEDLISLLEKLTQALRSV